MKVDKYKDGDRLTVRVQGEINVETAPVLKESIENSLSDVRQDRKTS